MDKADQFILQTHNLQKRTCTPTDMTMPTTDSKLVQWRVMAYVNTRMIYDMIIMKNSTLIKSLGNRTLRLMLRLIPKKP